MREAHEADARGVYAGMAPEDCQRAVGVGYPLGAHQGARLGAYLAEATAGEAIHDEDGIAPGDQGARPPAVGPADAGTTVHEDHREKGPGPIREGELAAEPLRPRGKLDGAVTVG